MKKVFTKMVFLAVLVLCAATGGALEKDLVLLEDKGSALDVREPAWIISYLKGGNPAVEKLKPYKNKYCFVVLASDADKAFAIANANDVTKLVDKTRNVSFSGAKKEADWWQLVEDKKTAAQTYRAFVLWTIDME